MVGTKGLMAPELNLYGDEQVVPFGYKGAAVDVFGAGTVLFNLLFANAPYNNATSDDFYYQHLARMQYSQFW